MTYGARVTVTIAETSAESWLGEMLRLLGRLGPQDDGLGLVRMLGLPLLAQAVGIHKPEAPKD